MALRSISTTTIGLTPIRTFDVPSDGADFLYGTDLADTIHGLGGNDTIRGGGATTFSLAMTATMRCLVTQATTPRRRLRQRHPDRWRSADTLISGRGTDAASYANAASGVILDLVTGGRANDAAGLAIRESRTLSGRLSQTLSLATARTM